jgi:hypothetical protein
MPVGNACKLLVPVAWAKCPISSIYEKEDTPDQQELYYLFLDNIVPPPVSPVKVS